MRQRHKHSICIQQWPVYLRFNFIAIQVNYPSKQILISNGFIVRHLGILYLITMCSYGLMILCKYLYSSVRPSVRPPAHAPSISDNFLLFFFLVGLIVFSLYYVYMILHSQTHPNSIIKLIVKLVDSCVLFCYVCCFWLNIHRMTSPLFICQLQPLIPYATSDQRPAMTR